MRRTCPWIAAVAAVAAGATAQDLSLDYPALLQRLTDVRWLHRPPLPGERGVQWSSYDRRSLRGSEHPDDWYANDDRGKYVRTEKGSAGTEYVMADAEGPGVIARIWSANPSGTLHVDVDGERWSVDFAALCAGKVAPIGEPLAGMRSKGGNCYLPIPFQKRAVVSVTKGDLYYHVNVLHLPPGARVPRFTPALLQQHAAEIAATAQALGRPEPLAPAGFPAALLEIEPGTVVTSFAVGVDAAPEGEDLGDLLRRVLLVVRCGKETTVRVPLLDFFAGGTGWRPHRGRLLGIGEDRTAYCAWPMPMPAGGSIQLVSEMPPSRWQPSLLHVALARGAARADDLLFRASYHQHKDFASRPFSDQLVLDASGGAGRFVGTALLVKNPHRAWWGEGDEKFSVDGEAFPSTFGTGTEDYFGYAWCCPDLFSSALHAQVQCEGPDNRGFTAVHRMHLLDAVPFQRSFHFDLEVWHWVPNLRLDYATVAYWYSAPAVQSGLPAVPAVAERALDRLPPPKVMQVDGALEAEKLKVVSCSGGKHHVQAMWFVEGAFSADAQVWWMDGKPGDALVLAVPVAKAGRYRVRAGLCRAKDYGIVQCSLGGAPLGDPIDLYAPDVAATGPLDLGVVELPAGQAELRVEIVGKNDKADPQHMAGIDYLLLEPVREAGR